MTGQTAQEDRQKTRMEQRRRAILEAAAEVFSEVGYDEATFEMVGDAVGLQKSSLYYYVSSKREILAELLREVVTEMEARAAELADTGSDDPEHRLRAFFVGHLRVTCGSPLGRLLAAHQDLVLGDRRDERLDEARRHHEARMQAILTEGVERGVFRIDNLKQASFLILGALNQVPRWWSPDGPGSPDDVAELLHRMVVDGIRAK